MQIRSHLPPGLFHSSVSNKTYAVAGSIWLEVPNDTTLSDIKWEPITIGKKEIKPTAQMEYSVEGSKGKMYKVIHGSSGWRCSCPAFGWSGNSRTCKHIEKLKKAK